MTLLFSIAILFSCKNKTHEKAYNNTKDSLVENLDTPKESLASKNKVEIDFAKNKVLLDIILLLPENAFQSWEWKLKDRTDWYNEIKANNFYVVENPDFFNQHYFEPNKAEFSIVDGFWSITLYKTTDSYIVITDDRTGNGSSLVFFEVKSNTVHEFSEERLGLSNYKNLLKKKEVETGCDALFEELNDPIFEHDFSIQNKIEIESSWYLSEDEYGKCLIGNAILYNFNSKMKQFEIEKIYWKPKQKN